MNEVTQINEPAPLNKAPDWFYSHQAKSLEKLAEAKRLLLCLTCGGGKTAVGLTFHKRLKDKLDFMRLNGKKVPKAMRTLVVGPKAVVHTVPETEAEKWPELQDIRFHRLWENEGQDACLRGDDGVYLVNFERLKWIIYNANRMAPFFFVWIDESSKISNPQAKRTKYAVGITKHAQFVLLSTGTPRRNHTGDLWPSLHIANPEKAGRISTFNSQYLVMNNGRFTDKEGAMDQLIDDFKDHLLSFTEAQLDIRMPDVVESKIYVELPEMAEEMMEEMESSLATMIQEQIIETSHVMGVLSKLRQIKQGRALSGAPGDENREVVIIHDEKLNALEGLMNQIGDDAIAVPIEFRADQQAIINRFDDEFGVEIVNSDLINADGGLKALIERVRSGETRIVLLPFKSAGHGIDGLQHVIRRVVFYDQTFSSEDRIQVIARIHRSGQKSTVFVHDILCRGHQEDNNYIKSLDEIIFEIAKGKIQAQNIFLYAVAAKLAGKAHESVDEIMKSLNEKLKAARSKVQQLHPDKSGSDTTAEFIKAKSEVDRLKKEMRKNGISN